MRSHRLLAALAAATVLGVAGCGDSQDVPGSGLSPTAGNGTDRAFAQAMIPHHESAVDMAKIAQERGSSAFVMRLADDIVRTQNAEISAMRAADERLQGAGVAKGSLGVASHMMGPDDLATLKKTKSFDRAFMELMIPHHEAAIPMSRAEIAKGEDAELKKLAQDIITAQQREIAAMRKELGKAGAAPTDDMDAEHGGGHSG